MASLPTTDSTAAKDWVRSGFKGYRAPFVNELSWRAGMRSIAVPWVLGSVAFAMLAPSSACSRQASPAPTSSSSSGLPPASGPSPTPIAALADNPSHFHGKAVSVVGTVTVEVLDVVGNAVRDPDSDQALWLFPDREPRMRFGTPQRCRIDGDFDSDPGPGGRYAGSLHVRAIYDCAPPP
jgi:hypothetical protein